MVPSGSVESRVDANLKRRQRLVLALAFILIASLLALATAGTAPPAEALDDDNVKFAVLGDFGDGSSAEGSVAALIDAHNVDLIATTGDNSYGSNPIDTNIGQFYSDYIGNYQGSYGDGATTNAFFPSLGNHDIGDGGGLPAYQNYFDLPGAGIPASNTSGTERYYDAVRGPVHFFAIDSNSDTSSTGTQAQWLQAQLAASTSQWKVVSFHHAARTSTSTHGAVTAMRWPFEAWGADAVFQGHNHIYERNIRDDNSDGVDFPWFVTGLGGKSLYGFGTELSETEYRYNSDYGSMIVTADQDSILFQFYSIVGGGTGTLMDSYLIEAPEPDDTEEPEITMLGTSPITIPHGDPYTDAGATALDDVDGDITEDIVTVGDVINTTSPGTYFVTYDVEDEAGNDADTKTRTVTVLEEDEGDTTPPVITLKGSSPVEVLVGASYVDAGATATDDVDGNITSDIKTTSTVNTAVAGSYVVVYNLHDAAGNAASQVTRDVNVVAGLFDDTSGSVFADDIEWLADEGITQGCNPPTNTLFCPDNPVSRGQMSAFLRRALADVLSVDPSRAADFVDVDGSVFEGDIAWLSAAGITRSCNPQEGGTKFCPTGNVTRGQMAALIKRAFGGLIRAPGPSGQVFADSQSSIFKGDIQWMADTGISKGCNPPVNTNFCPSSNVTRGQMAVFIRRAVEAAGL